MFGACPIGGTASWTPAPWPAAGDPLDTVLAPAIRPVHAGDTPGLNAFFLGLSPRSRRLRFHGAVNALPASALRQLSAPDDAVHATLVAEAAGSHKIVAEARYVRDAHDEQRAEFALAVADDWQGQGLGRRLLTGLLEHARRQGLDALHGSVLDENQPMLWLLQTFGARAVRAPGPGYAIEWRVPTRGACGVA